MVPWRLSRVEEQPPPLDLREMSFNGHDHLPRDDVWWFLQSLSVSQSRQLALATESIIILVMCDDDTSQLNVLPEPITFEFLPGLMYLCCRTTCLI